MRMNATQKSQLTQSEENHYIETITFELLTLFTSAYNLAIFPT